jgi:carnosine N-methyltransferase
MDKVDSTMVQFVRDWSADGVREREASYGPILKALDEEFAHVPVQ